MLPKDKNVLQEPQADYEKAEMDQLRNALKRSYTERFIVMTPLIKRSIMIRNAKITPKPFLPNLNNRLWTFSMKN